MLSKIIKVFIWFVLSMVVFSLIGSCLSAANDILVAIGVISVIIYFIITWKTRFFINIHLPRFLKKKEKDEEVS